MPKVRMAQMKSKMSSMARSLGERGAISEFDKRKMQAGGPRILRALGDRGAISQADIQRIRSRSTAAGKPPISRTSALPKAMKVQRAADKGTITETRKRQLFKKIKQKSR